MAGIIRAALGESKTPLTAAAATAAPPAIDLDTAQLDQIMGARGQNNGGVYQLRGCLFSFCLGSSRHDYAGRKRHSFA
jgi:hypothetical protein